MKCIITTDNEEQSWLDAFNSWARYSYEMNQEVEEEYLNSVEMNIERFNNEFACGPAISLIEQEEK